MTARPPARPPAVQKIPRRHNAPRFAIYAGFVSRLMAMVVDLLVIFGVWIGGGIAVTFISQTSGISQILSFLEGFFSWLTPLQSFLISATFEVVALLALGLFYFTFFYSFGGATLGKYLMGLRVVRQDGFPVSGTQAALRTVAYAASALPVYVGFLNVLTDDRRRAWHDILTGTSVVHTWRARPDERFLREVIDRVSRER